MSLNRSNPSNQRWRIAHLSAALATIGYVEAPDEHVAIVKALLKFNIGPKLARKLIAKKTKAQPHRKRRRGARDQEGNRGLDPGTAERWG
jgi:hypothetical protein